MTVKTVLNCISWSPLEMSSVKAKVGAKVRIPSEKVLAA